MPAEIVFAGERRHGFLAEVSPGGAFIQMLRPIEPGHEIELWFADSQLTPQVARARVVWRRVAPAAAASVLRAGIGIEWIEAPQFACGLAERGIEVEIECDPPDAAAASPDSIASPVYDSLEPIPGPGSSGPEVTCASSHGEIVPVDLRPIFEETIELGPASIRAEVVVIDEGELAAFEGLARSLGAHTLRMRWGAQADPVVWEAPPRVVVVSARVAMLVPLSDAVRSAGTLGVAVCDSEASTLRARLRRQGYELIVQRTTHPATLRLLLASLLFQRRERRKDRRRAFGAEVGFWRGFRRTGATLLELSPSGGSLLLAIDLPRGTKLSVRVPAKHAGGRTLALAATAVRSTPTESGVLVGLCFEKSSARKRARLAELIRGLDESGPVPLSTAQSVSSSAGVAMRVDRRSGRRVRLEKQALALDPATGIARDVLFGTDLSLGGMRIEPHPRLARGAQLRLALQPPGGAALVTLRAEVARDDGERGLVLRFLAPPASTRLALERMLDAAHEIERTTRNRKAREERVVLGTLVEAELASR